MVADIEAVTSSSLGGSHTGATDEACKDVVPRCLRLPALMMCSTTSSIQLVVGG